MRHFRTSMRRWAITISIGLGIGTTAFGTDPEVEPTATDARRALGGKTVDEWTRALRDRANRDHSRAAWMLAAFGPEAKAAVPDLVEALDQGDLGVMNALARIGPDAAPAVPLLAKQFRKEECLHGKMGTFLYGRYSGPMYALVRIGAASVPELVKALEEPGGEYHPCAAEALGEIGPPAKAAVPALIRELQLPRLKLDFQDTQAQARRRQAVIALGRIGPAAAPAIPALNALFDQEDDKDHFQTLRALSRIGSPPVTKLISDFPRERVAEDLAQLGSKAREAIPALRLALSAKEARVRFDAAQALAAIDPSATDAIPVLIEALDHRADETVEVRKVPQLLAQLGPKAKVALPALLAQLTPEWPDPEILRAVVQIDPLGQQCIPALIQALKHKDSEVVFTASECLGLLGPRARTSIPSLVVVIDSDLGADSLNWEPRVSAINAIVRIDRNSPLVIPTLIRALKCEGIKELKSDRLDFDVCDCSTLEAATKALRSCGPRATAAVPVMIDILTTRETSNHPDMAYASIVYTLGQLGPDALPAVPILRQLLEKKGRLSWPAAAALYRLAPDGKELAKKRLESPIVGQVGWQMWDELEGRALLLGTMDQTSVEADAAIRSQLENVNDTLEAAEIEGFDRFPEWMIEQLARFGAGSRLAIPRLEELRRHPYPWIRMWAGEALARIAKPES